MKSVAIIGAGASGMAAAIMASGNGVKVTVFERNDVAGKKILVTGNGRCNLTNLVLKNKKIDLTQYYHGSCVSILENLYKEFDVEKTIEFFEQIGIHTKDRNGLVYPYSDQASQVRDCLEYECVRLGAVIRKGVKVTGITPVNVSNIEKYELILGNCADGSMSREVFDCCIIACGSRAMPLSGSDGFGYKLCKKLGVALEKERPVLCKCMHNDTFLSEAAGVRCRAKLSILSNGKFIKADEGELQLVKNALSGIVTFQLSETVGRLLKEGKNTEISINFCPDFEKAELKEYLTKRFYDAQKVQKSKGQALVGFINDKLIPVIVRHKDLYSALSDYRVAITELDGYAGAQTCAGGVLKDELNENLSLKKYPGIFICGELLDVDGVCGGFNLQAAFSSGLAAGKYAGM